MANTIALAQKYAPLLDEIYQKASLTSVFDATAVDFTGANTVKIYKTSMDGLAKYARNTGYVAGDVTGEWETLTLSQDRGRKFTVDAMDDEETLNLAFGTLSSEFLRTKVVPEIDAYRFAKYATGAALNGSGKLENVATLIDAAEAAMGDAEVPTEGNYLFVSEDAYKGLKADINRTTTYDAQGVSKDVETYDGMPVIRVPQGRFYTTCTINDAGGFANAGDKIGFMIINQEAVVQVAKHAVPRIFDPMTNQDANAWRFDYRIYHDAFVNDNKAKGIYVYKVSTTNG